MLFVAYTADTAFNRHTNHMSSVNHPAYSKIATEITMRIENKELNPGDRLPSEREMATEFGVARMTVRQALDQLQLDGAIGRRRGRTGGSFVLGNRPVIELTRMEGFLPQLIARNHEVTSEILLADMIPATQEVALHLDIEPLDEVVQVVRLRKVDNTPLLVESSFFPSALVPGMLDQDLSGSLYQLLDREWGASPVRKEEIISPGVATRTEQKHLKVSNSMPLLRINRVAFTITGTPIEFSVDVLRSDAAQIKVITESTAEV